ncbi:hypothetical protein ACFYPG_17970 [Micromonospora sp. NPDC005553]|uniref:hypothetical protein n=1 Tax=Micromonospora sp. NPDC005553 TaxID=3364232 RepID=UPI0036A8B7A5
MSRHQHTDDEWDDKLVDSLGRDLGDAYEVRYPRVPDETDPSYATWGAGVRREIAALDEVTGVIRRD